MDDAAQLNAEEYDPRATSLGMIILLFMQRNLVLTESEAFVGIVNSCSFLTKKFSCIDRLPPRWLESAAAPKSFNDGRRVRSAKISNTVSFRNRFHADTASINSVIAVRAL